MKTTTSIKKFGNRAPLCAFLLIPLALACFALSPQVRAVDPAPDGGYPNQNTAEGEDALFSLDTSQGVNNTAVGFNALFSNSTGDSNTANGASALFSNTTGNFNTAVGEEALFHNTTGSVNTAIGFQALFSSTTAIWNTAVGSSALFRNTAGLNNTAIGFQALMQNRTGSQNTAIGTNALELNTNGTYNIAVGSFTLGNNTSGSSNIGIGYNVLTGNKTGSSNIALGHQAGFNLRNGSNNIYIANDGGTSSESATIRVGTTGTQTATFIAGISGATIADGVGVVVGADGQLGTVVSSERYKDAVKPMGKASEVILALRPVTFRYKHELDPKGIAQFGLVAEDVEKVNPDLVARDEQGKPYSVRYEAVNAMLLNEFLKAHRKMEEQEATIAQLKATSLKQREVNAEQQKAMETLAARLNEQAAQIETVSAQISAERGRVAAASPSFGGLEASKFSTQVVADNQ